MFRKKLLFTVTILALLVLVPMSALAASKSNDSGITLHYPDDGVCDPNEVIYTTGDGVASVRYRFYYPYEGGLVYFPWQSMSGQLSVTYPYDQVPEGVTSFSIVVAAKDASGTRIGSQIQVKWNCTPPPPGGEGCTPGYWRNHLEDWPPTGYSPGADFDTTFGIDLFDPDITLRQAIRARGGGNNKLARHGTAGLLSAAHPDVNYPYSEDEVIALVQGGNAGALVAANELGCSIR